MEAERYQRKRDFTVLDVIGVCATTKEEFSAPESPHLMSRVITPSDTTISVNNRVVPKDVPL